MSVTDTPAETTTPARAVEVTDAAAAKVYELVQSEGNPELALRVAVRPGGCSGFSYEMYFDTEFTDDDVISMVPVPGVEGANVKVAVDPTSAQLIKGATLDYKNGLQDSGFSINNPNASRTCGCGSSFS